MSERERERERERVLKCVSRHRNLVMHETKGFPSSPRLNHVLCSLVQMEEESAAAEENQEEEEGEEEGEGKEGSGKY